MSIKPTIHISFAIVLIYFLLSTNLFCFAETACQTTSTSHCINPDEQFEFAEQYFQNGEYDKAAVEYSRYIHFFPNEKQVEWARYRMGKSYYAAGQYNRAKKVFTEIVSVYGKTQTALNAYFDISRCFLNLEDVGGAVSTLKQLISQTDNPDIIDRA